MECLLCLNSDQDMTTCIKVNSLPWLECNIQQMIDKYLWNIESLTSEDFICSLCWYSLNDFHQFYTRIKEAHDNTEIVVKVEMDTLDEVDIKPEIIQETLIEPTVAYQEYSDPEDIKDDEDDGSVQHHKVVDAHEETFPDVLEEKYDSSSDNSYDVDEEYLPNTRQHKRNSSKKSSTNPVTKSKEIQKSQQKPASKRKLSTSKLNHIPKMHCAEFDKFLKKHFKFNCDKCQQKFESFRQLSHHYNEEHQEQGYALCCGTKFFERRLLVDHVNFHLNPDYFKCILPGCDKAFPNRNYLLRHMYIHEEKKHSCEECGRKFGQKAKLDRHRFRHLPASEKKFPCSVCGKFYINEKILKQHQRVVHLNIYARVCEICGQTMPDLPTFKRHMEKHEDLPATCDICGLVTVNQLTLRLHKKLKHPLDGKSDFKCHICEKVSPTQRALKKHIYEVHELGYQYKCTLCSKEFKRLDSFKSHMAIHTGTPLYRCSWCPKECYSSGNMHQHRKKAHPVEWEETQRKKYSGVI